jgi:hypothetical protein
VVELENIGFAVVLTLFVKETLPALRVVGRKTALMLLKPYGKKRLTIAVPALVSWAVPYSPLPGLQSVASALQKLTVPDVTVSGLDTVAVSVTSVPSATELKGPTASVVVVGVWAAKSESRTKGTARPKETFFKKEPMGLCSPRGTTTNAELPCMGDSIQKS